VDALAGNFDNAEWIEIWDADFDTHVLDTSARSDQSSNTRGALDIRHDVDTEVITRGKQFNAHFNRLKIKDRERFTDSDK
jgi:hypothetical protein